MIYAVFLCNVKWEISRIRQCNTELSLQEGVIFTDLILEKEEVQKNIEEHYAREVTFIKQALTMTAVIDVFKEGKLVILASVKNNLEFIEFHNAYSRYQEWAKTHLMGLYHDEYYLIQQMNNQLVDAKRRLSRSNRQLESTLEENKKINEKLEEARVYAERANLSKTRFLANMSHDIRTPMNAIIGLSELMQHYLDKPEILKNYIGKLQSSSHYLLDLINDILDLSKIENGSLELKTEPMDIGVQIEQIVTIIRPQITQKNQHLSVESECAEYGKFLGDPIRFRQILINLFSNAVKYTPEGGYIHFGIRQLEEHEHICRYQFVLEDSGIGMTEEFIEHIFDPFARAEDSVSEIQGTGLGMAITKSIVDAMDGHISVTSVPGKGSRFQIELPFERCAKEDKADEKQTENLENVRISLNGMRFLCAEDNELNAEILSAMLELEGATCTIFENGKLLVEAFPRVAPGQYDAILMDVQMPVMDGYEATRKIRNSVDPLGKKIPIIAMTANAFEEDRKRAIAAGMNEHIAKPIDIAKMKKVLDKIKRE